MGRVAAPLRRRLAPALIVAVAMLCAAPMSAQAEKLDRRDARRDVAGVALVGSGIPNITLPGRADLDIVRTVYRHKRHRIRLRFNFAELIPPPAGVLGAFVVIRTNEGVHREISVAYWTISEAPFTEVSITNRIGEEFDCRIYRSFDFARNVVIIGMRRACLSGPRWIRVGVDVTGIPDVENPGPHMFVDTALRRGFVASAFPPLSPRLHRAPPRR